MTSGTMIRIWVVLVLVDVGCLALGKPQSWSHFFGKHGLVTDFLLLVIVGGFYLFRGNGKS
ncbi:MAG TPA: hypothetical protein VN911_15075 [Candidatus Acidoferrum sp.]|nr:hypothetical protein [Candidatus Acidoferrum sp.]